MNTAQEILDIVCTEAMEVPDQKVFFTPKNRILVTGGCGFIGRHLVKKLLADGHEVLVVDDLSGGCIQNLSKHKALRIEVVSILETKRLTKIFDRFSPQRCYHISAYAAEALSPFIRNFNYTNNVVGSANVINNCINFGVEELIFLSSVAVYGKSHNPFGWVEDSITRPSDPYGNAKLCVERDIQIAHDQHGLNYKIFRPHNVIGTHQNIFDKYRNVLGIFIKNLLEKKPLPIFGDGKQIRQFTPVEYVVKGLTSEIIPRNEIYNIGSNQEYEVKNIAHTLVATNLFSQIVPELQFLPARHEAFHPKCDHSKIERYIGPCEFNLLEELKKIVEWAKTEKGINPSGCNGNRHPEIEVSKLLPEAWK
jgi:UDP-glucose 4-epimerase